MRIISGRHKGKRLTAPKKLPVRPTTDMAKESLFNILNNSYYFEDLSVLDLFAGTGNISYEFASRGAANSIAVDSNSGCANYISKTAKALELDITVVKSDVFTYLSKTKAQFDIIFADPPYSFDVASFSKIPELVFHNKLLGTDGLLIVEHASHTNLSELSNFTEKRKYGSSTFSFFGF